MKKTKFFIAAASAFLAIAPVFSEKGPVYISPNNDGVQDNLEVPLRIREKRYIKEWSFIIEDEKGQVVRTIGNKENRPSKLTVKTFFKQAVTPKTGVIIPEVLVWNGVMDDGEIAPDGKYFYYVTATDDNDNSATTKKLVVYVKNTPPEVQLQQLTENEKIFGEGSKSVLHIKQSGTKEDLWNAHFFDAEGKEVRSLLWRDSEPVDFDWDGTDNFGMNVDDGVYSYRITATDRAGNKSNPVALTNIIFSAEKPATNISINGSRYFSPNDDGILDTMLFNLTIPIPEAKTRNKLVSWKVEILDKAEKPVFEFAGNETAPDTITFSGKDKDGKKFEEGGYKAKLTAKYLNGYEPSPIYSPVFILDTIPPQATLASSLATFSPDGDGNQDSVKIDQKIAENHGSPIKNWHAEISNASTNEVVKTVEFGEFPLSSYIWNGTGDDGKIAEDAVYRYILSASDEAGNSAVITAPQFAIDTSKSEIILAMQYNAFSPNGNGVQDTIKFTPTVKSGSAVKNYKFVIADKDGNAVYSVEKESALPANFIWNGAKNSGEKCEDGFYKAVLETVAENGSQVKVQTSDFELDTKAPVVAMEVPYKTFSRDGESKKSSIPVTAKTSSENEWKVNVVDAAGKTVKSWNFHGEIPAFAWDGTNEAGNIAPDGIYKIIASSTDNAGNSGKTEIDSIKLDSREVKSLVTADTDGFSPNGDGFKEEVKFTIRSTPLDGISSWEFDILSIEGKVVKKFVPTEENKALPKEIIWNGKGDDDKICEGVFMGNLKEIYEKGNEVDVKSSAFISSVSLPEISVMTSPAYFSPDNDGIDDELYIKLKGSSVVGLKDWSFTIKDPSNGKTFWSTKGKSSITPQIVWDGRGQGGELVQSAMDYPYEFVVTDVLGLINKVEGKISVDVLVIREGNVLKMAVPAIIFRKDSADFGVTGSVIDGKTIKEGITQEQYDNNIRVLKRIATILNKFKDYTVKIEGHANNVTGTEDEETSTANGNIPLVPLSEQRAEFVKQQLKKNGVDLNRMESVGMGGRKPVVKRSDRDNWWKNRRVEFILNK